MNNIKNFTYLDDYKMYSISSQIFEGLTEHIIRSTNEGVEEKTEQKGNIGSGQLMADLIVNQKNETQKILFHDYSYNLFENKLIANNKVLIINEENFEEKLGKIDDFNFIKVTGRIIFNDTKQIEEIVSSFNQLGLAFTQITNSSYQNMSEDSRHIEAIKDKNHKAKAEAVFKSKLQALREEAKGNGMQMSEDFLENVKYILNYGYGGQFEVQIPFTSDKNLVHFSATIKRDKLKEHENLIIKKHGRTSEKRFTIFGILTQVKKDTDKLHLFKDKEDKNIKEFVLNIISLLTDLENTFTGKLSNEYVIDPIAIYNEI